ncbi:hypothetical protein O9G_003686 [Rozella allomycis CSF55]|uniref:Uncharacterized protein n=1 Tax=Rozella allomycis (strain CSF55) TaxID=988480 RepID=A0A075AYS4_ROZAC|nr:hypothetical protein O9G_003686 [Rozella allomycis CSF55]|eukprot:EPZ35427.1 hypothetical protein O9G_003686 [Rozella allomycis CSF55]
MANIIRFEPLDESLFQRLEQLVQQVDELANKVAVYRRESYGILRKKVRAHYENALTRVKENMDCKFETTEVGSPDKCIIQSKQSIQMFQDAKDTFEKLKLNLPKISSKLERACTVMDDENDRNTRLKNGTELPDTPILERTKRPLLESSIFPFTLPFSLLFRSYRVLLWRRLGLKFFNHHGSCLECTKGQSDWYGDHATVCQGKHDLANRHNAIRDEIFHVASQGGLAPQKEVQGLLDNESLKPADIFIPVLENSHNVCIDVTIGSPYVENVFNKTVEEGGAALMKSRDQKNEEIF